MTKEGKVIFLILLQLLLFSGCGKGALEVRFSTKVITFDAVENVDYFFTAPFPIEAVSFYDADDNKLMDFLRDYSESSSLKVQWLSVSTDKDHVYSLQITADPLLDGTRREMVLWIYGEEQYGSLRILQGV